MQKAISTRYRGPTNTRGSKIIAKAMDNAPRSMGMKYSLSTEGRHCLAAMEYARHMGWTGFYVAGALADGNCYVCTATDATQWAHASALVDFARTYDRPLGNEGEDWFFLPNEASKAKATEISCHD